LPLLFRHWFLILTLRRWYCHYAIFISMRLRHYAILPFHYAIADASILMPLLFSLTFHYMTLLLLIIIDIIIDITDYFIITPLSPFFAIIISYFSLFH
jgi:hypothetical protein